MGYSNKNRPTLQPWMIQVKRNQQTTTVVLSTCNIQ